MFRGSRKHVLDWVRQADFASQLLQLAAPAEVKLAPTSVWAPVGNRDTKESRLGDLELLSRGTPSLWSELRGWWLAADRGNSPNWDLALVAEIEGVLGLVLVEAKAHHAELSIGGKRKPSGSAGSRANHERIVAALESARMALSSASPLLSLSIASHYQLANRIAFTWKLAALGVPVVLVYLGFIGDEGIRDVGAPFRTTEKWNHAITAYLTQTGALPLFEKRHQLEGAPFWMLCRSRPILEPSPSLDG